MITMPTIDRSGRQRTLAACYIRPAMHDVVSRLRGRLQHGLATQEILDRLARRGIVLYPYLVFQEFAEVQFSAEQVSNPFRARQLTENDTAQLTAMPDRPRTEAGIRERFRLGHVGIGAFEQDSIVAYTWCDLQKLSSPGQGSALRPLERDEAYMYDAYTIPRCRGRGLVPFLRSEVYKVMQTLGRRRLYSVSVLFNRPARRFKAKLGAREVELRLSINLFQKFKRDVLLKRYPPAAR